MKPDAPPEITVTITVNGIVQGVGFRPFIYKLATTLGLSGTVANTEKGVLITVQGTEKTIDLFTKRIKTDAPPVASISKISSVKDPQPTPFTNFSIIKSEQKDSATVPITPDIAICDDCKEEITNPGDRRYRYPFTNCTNCGPRFSIVQQVPYDRPFTSMHRFTMCNACAKEYNDPFDRRFHAQPNACSECGPTLSWHNRQGKALHTTDCIEQAAEALASDRIVAIKGLGGFHLAANALTPDAVSRLRKRKNRPTKPLAIMVQDIVAAKKFCRISEEEEKLLRSPQAPIVLLEKLEQSIDLAENLAEGMQIMGIMLAYTPLHYLLFEHAKCPEALVMTSGNFSNEPICTSNEDAITRLTPLADYFLLHNRDIVTRVDDSVARLMNGTTHLLRRARGYTPRPISLGAKTMETIACGGEMKNTFCIVRNNEAYLSQHIGEMNNPNTFDFFEESVNHLSTVLQFSPQLTVHDLHPDYQATRYAKLQSNLAVGIQHHHAHAGAVMAEHGLTSPCICIILDGTGYGEDETIWGGEVYLTDRASYVRLGHLETFQLPGGDKAALEPWRSALSLCYKHYHDDQFDLKIPPAIEAIEKSKRKVIMQLLEKNVNSPLTSSCGRLFDAISAMLGLCLISQHEGHAAMLLESSASTAPMNAGNSEALKKNTYPVKLKEENNAYIITTYGLLDQILVDLENETPVEIIAFRFHHWLIDSLSSLADTLKKAHGISDVILSGGCMQNKLLLEGLTLNLTKMNFNVYSGEMAPVNDGGLSLGQAYVGSAMIQNTGSSASPDMHQLTNGPNNT